jgi:hypothetical protein
MRVVDAWHCAESVCKVFCSVPESAGIIGLLVVNDTLLTE